MVQFSSSLAVVLMFGTALNSATASIGIATAPPTNKNSTSPPTTDNSTTVTIPPIPTDCNYADGYFGENCDEVNCTTSTGICDDDCYGFKGTGVCTSCFFPQNGAFLPYGEACNHKALCVHGECSEGECWGINGTGRCDTNGIGEPLCDDGWVRAGCNYRPTCVVRNAIGGEYDMLTGHCIRCLDGYAGADCASGCLCESDDPFTCGQNYSIRYCDNCTNEFFGVKCDQQVQCAENSICPTETCSGIFGNGECQCIEGYWGSDCTKTTRNNAAVVVGGLGTVAVVTAVLLFIRIRVIKQSELETENPIYDEY